MAGQVVVVTGTKMSGGGVGGTVEKSACIEQPEKAAVEGGAGGPTIETTGIEGRTKAEKCGEREGGVIEGSPGAPASCRLRHRSMSAETGGAEWVGCM